MPVGSNTPGAASSAADLTEIWPKLGEEKISETRPKLERNSAETRGRNSTEIQEISTKMSFTQIAMAVPKPFGSYWKLFRNDNFEQAGLHHSACWKSGRNWAETGPKLSRNSAETRLKLGRALT